MPLPSPSQGVYSPTRSNRVHSNRRTSYTVQCALATRLVRRWWQPLPPSSHLVWLCISTAPPWQEYCSRRSSTATSSTRSGGAAASSPATQSQRESSATRAVVGRSTCHVDAARTRCRHDERPMGPTTQSRGEPDVRACGSTLRRRCNYDAWKRHAASSRAGLCLAANATTPCAARRLCNVLVANNPSTTTFTFGPASPA